MPQDAFTLYHQAKELNKMLAGGKVNRITQPAESEVYFGVYANGARCKLAVSANVATARVCTSANEKENPLAAYNFCMLLRKHLLNAVIESVSLDGFDRVVKIVFSCYDELFGDKKKILYAEIMGKYSNAVLVQDGKVLTPEDPQPWVLSADGKWEPTPQTEARWKKARALMYPT